MLPWLFLLVSTAAAHDHSDWQAALDKYRSAEALLDYAGIAQAGALDGYMAGLSTAEVPSDAAAKMAFWVNAYNAITVHLVSQSWPIGSIRELDGGEVWTTRSFTVAGQALTLDQIQKQKILPLGDPRAHVVLNCASLGCPPLRAKALTQDNLEAQLSTATRTWLGSTGVTIDEGSNEIVLSSIFDWYALDFPNPGGAALPGVEARMQGPLRFIAGYMPADLAAFMLAGGYSHRFYPFNWAVNSR